MSLSKIEIQQILREMKVKFDADESFEALKRRLQQENHSRWLRSITDAGEAGAKTGVVRVRRRKHSEATANAVDHSSPAAARPARAHPPSHRIKSESATRQPTVEKPLPGKPWKAVADGTEPFNREKNVFRTVLRRARQRCESCDTQVDENGDRQKLAPSYILPPSRGGEHSIKNVVALCPACRRLLESDPPLKMIKTLRRQTRSKVYGDLKVEKKAVRRRSLTPGRNR